MLDAGILAAGTAVPVGGPRNSSNMLLSSG